MRWIPLIALAGCVPISADEYAGGRSSIDGGADSTVDSSVDNVSAREDASLDAFVQVPTVDAASDAMSVVIGPPPYLVDAGSTKDDAGGMDAGVADASVDASAPVVIDCTTKNVVCEDFELSLPKCPDTPGSKWTECEHIGDPSGPQLEGLAPDGYALRARMTADAGARSQRVLRMVPTDADYFEAQFDMITDPTDNKSFVWMKLQQEVGLKANGEPLNYPGVSLTGSNGNMAVMVETQRTLSISNGSDVEERALGPWPQGWIHVTVQVDFKKPSVHVEYYNPKSPWDYSGYTASKIPVNRQYFALGLYSEEPGAVRMLYDNVMFYAKKNGVIIPML